MRIKGKNRVDFLQNSAKMVTKVATPHFAEYKYLSSKDLCVASFLFCRLLNPTQQKPPFFR